MIDRACISLGEVCNLKCTYCHFTPRLTGASQQFSFSELTLLIDNIHEYCEENQLPLFKIGIVGSGEPLFEFEKIKRLIEYVEEKSMKQLSFYTITNGTIFNDEIRDFFYTHRNRIALCFSLDGYKELHEAGREGFDDVMSSISRYEALFKVKPPINCTVHRLTIESASKLFAFFCEHNFSNVTFSRLVDVNDPTFKISKEEYIAFIESCKEYDFSVRQLRAENQKKYDCVMYGKLCGVGKTNIFFTRMGIFPCGRFYGLVEYSYGAFSNKLSEVADKMKKMRPIADGECYFDKYLKMVDR